MFYFNDFPRFFQKLAHGAVRHQDSCLHGGASIGSLISEGNGMFPQFDTEPALLSGVEYDGEPMHDYGACTVEQLLTGLDDRLNDPGYPLTSFDPFHNSTNRNPCHDDPHYRAYAVQHYAQQHDTFRQEHATGTLFWDYLMINDNTRNPARAKTRHHALETLEQFHLPWLLQTGATPVFLWTQAYSIESTPERNMTGLDDVANFTSLTYVGYQAYVDLLKQHLPTQQEPRIAKVGLAFLVVHEERPQLWHKLFHSDHIHASPLGSFLQGCVVYATLTGQMPSKKHVLQRHHLNTLWSKARMMQHAWEPPNPFPTHHEARYLYQVAEKVALHGYEPDSFIPYHNDEVAYEG